MLLISWNIDSLNVALTSGSTRAQKTRYVLTRIVEKKPDILAIQEIRLCATGPIKRHVGILARLLPDYKYVWCSSEEPTRKGYAGTMYLYKNTLEPVVMYPTIGAPDIMDFKGRVIILESPEYLITQVYTSNTGGELKRLGDRQGWDKEYIEYLQEFDKEKPVLVSGDYNAVHEETDLKHPEDNYHPAGFADKERVDFTELLSTGFTDSSRKIHGNIPEVYSWWAQRIKIARVNNSGWRMDYWLTGNRIVDKIKKSEMMDTGERADHCPIVLEIDL